MPSETAIVRLNALLRGEFAAIDLYRELIALLPESADAEAIRPILAGHEEIAKTLHHHLRQQGGTPEEITVPWSVFVNLDRASITNSFASILEALLAGETLGRREYDGIADDDLFPSSVRDEIRRRILPIAAEHVGMLARMISYRESVPCRNVSTRL
jgi:hypothetical protein